MLRVCLFVLVGVFGVRGKDVPLESSSLTHTTFRRMVNRSDGNGPHAVLFYFSARKDPKVDKFLASGYDEIAKMFRNAVVIGRLDCTTSPQQCATDHVTENALLLYPAWPQKTEKLDLAQVMADKSILINLITSSIPEKHYQKISNYAEMDKFLGQQKNLPKVLLFTSAEKPRWRFRALARSFKDKMSFASVTVTEETDSKILNKFSLNKFSSETKLLVVPVQSSKPDVYTGAPHFADMFNWANVHAETFVKGGGFSEEKPVKPWAEAPCPELTAMSFNDVCFGKNNGFCVIYLADKFGEEELKMVEKIKNELPEFNTGTKYRFMWMNTNLQKAVFKKMQESISELQAPTFVVLNPHKRVRFVTVSDNNLPLDQTLPKLIDDIQQGNTRFTYLKGKLPNFVQEVIPNDEL